MAFELHQVLRQLSLIDSHLSTSASTVEDIISKACISCTAPQLLTAISKTELDAVVYCRSVECLALSTSIDWLFPELAVLLQHPDDQKSVTRLHIEIESINSLVDNVYRTCLVAVIDKLHESAAVGTLSKEEDALSDSPVLFHNVAIRACSALRALGALMDIFSAMRTAATSFNMKQISDTFNTLLRHASFKALILSLEHQEKLPWTNTESIAEAKKLVGVTCRVNSCSSFESLLNGYANQSTVPCVGYLQTILGEILPKLTKSNWKLNPSIPYVFCYCLHSVDRAHLGDHLPTLFPPSLIFFDDHQEVYRLLGLHCLQHILSTCSKTELQWFGRADVIYDALQRAFYGCDQTLLDPLIECVLTTLNILEIPPCQVTGVRNVGRHDQFFVRYLSNMESENVIVIRRIYSRRLPRFITTMGLTTVRHLRRLVRLLVDYLAINDRPDELCRFSCLDALYVILQRAWPRVGGHADTIMKSLVRLVHDIGTEHATTTPDEVSDRLTRRALDCVHLLRVVCPAYVGLDDSFFSRVRQNIGVV